ncbi:11521_t:CDS:2 [Funneliformis mosseae]|uniref:11521_t:CDS:1 n=1 Tax=Funneliformis mosseae TaxID=27381 RepID=A0A9N9H471_FUNMO|nr:11521_t:CDS:2 [Funneliformis mosseae]
MTCVPAAISTFVEVAGKASSVGSAQDTNLKANVCFRADTGYNSCLTFNMKSPNGKSSCSSDGVWCFKVVSFNTGSIDYSIMFANRESTVQSSVDPNPSCSDKEVTAIVVGDDSRPGDQGKEVTLLATAATTTTTATIIQEQSFCTGCTEHSHADNNYSVFT